VWKSFDWEAMNRLHQKGYISDPVGKAKSVVLTEKGLHEAEQLFKKLFG
jgi:Mn-dependent DtxR family transcriptional regulator